VDVLRAEEVPRVSTVIEVAGRYFWPPELVVLVFFLL
jgi:hypothetical protein